MLKSWSIENFKPIVDSGELKLAPVTVFAGLNSSGKSSLLQSILMISQTLSSRVLDRPLLPNGPIVQLGTFEDILNGLSHSSILTISFELEMEKEEIKTPSRRVLTDGRLVHSRLGIKSSKVSVHFFSPYGNGASSSAIEAAKVAVDSVSIEVDTELEPLKSATQLDFFLEEEMEPLKLGIVIEKMIDTELNHFLGNVAQSYLRLVPYSGEQPNYLGKFKVYDEEIRQRKSEQYLIALSHFLPVRLIKSFKIEIRRRQRLERAVNYLFDYPNTFVSSRQFSDLFEPDTPISEELRKSICELCEEEKINENFSGRSLRDIVVWFTPLKLKARGRKKALGEKIKQAIVQSFLQDLLKTESENSRGSEGLEAVVNNVYVGNLDRAVEQITRFFTSKIRYLGPLRADPQAAQKFSPSSELDDVGAKGEYAAAVYDANQKARVEWYNPFSNQVERGTLKVALDSWARYLGVANQIQIETAGQSGVSWQVVHLTGQKPLPLTAVGVGVSQILPILVMGLLAPSDTLLIVEQPELHLHPRVQARLGDFFVGLSKCKKQCLIETHSENLVNQLRYHIVQSGGQDKSECMIYFVDQDEKGAARFELVEISAKGNILNWPEGFFDETMHQEDRITAESMKRRANVAKNG